MEKPKVFLTHKEKISSWHQDKYLDNHKPPCAHCGKETFLLAEIYGTDENVCYRCYLKADLFWVED